MKEYLNNVNDEKLKTVFEVRNAYDEGKLTMDEARAILKEKVQSLEPYEVALIEQELKEEIDDQCRKEDIQAMLDLFDGILNTSKPNLPDTHPIECYYRENEKMKELLLSVEDLVQYPVIKNQWFELYDQMIQWRKHLSRKQNQLYPVLEKKGFTRPTTTMWTLDDFIRDEITQAYNLIKEGKEDEFIELQSTVVADVRDLMQKEETVLYPTSLALISAEEFEDMKLGDQEIGFANITVEPRKTETPTSSKPTEGFTNELANLLGKYGYHIGNDKEFDVKTGKMTLEQINLVYQHMPVDLSYVDENEIVRFYTDTKHRVFPRSKNVIGRDVKNCHPKKSVHIVEEIIEKFRNGEQNEAEFWINKPEIFIYIKYVAVRDEDGKFRGILEMMQDCTHIRALTGSQTLLTWSNQEHGITEEEQPAPVEEKPETTSSSKIDPESITPETKLKDLLAADPNLKQYLFTISDKFRALDTPLARIMLPKATVEKMSERTGVALDEIIAKLKQYFQK